MEIVCCDECNYYLNHYRSASGYFVYKNSEINFYNAVCVGCISTQMWRVFTTAAMEKGLFLLYLFGKKGHRRGSWMCVWLLLRFDSLLDVRRHLDKWWHTSQNTSSRSWKRCNKKRIWFRVFQHTHFNSQCITDTYMTLRLCQQILRELIL